MPTATSLPCFDKSFFQPNRQGKVRKDTVRLELKFGNNDVWEASIRCDSNGVITPYLSIHSVNNKSCTGPSGIMKGSSSEPEDTATIDEGVYLVLGRWIRFYGFNSPDVLVSVTKVTDK